MLFRCSFSKQEPSDKSPQQHSVQKACFELGSNLPPKGGTTGLSFQIPPLYLSSFWLLPDLLSQENLPFQLPSTIPATPQLSPPLHLFLQVLGSRGNARGPPFLLVVERAENQTAKEMALRVQEKGRVSLGALRKAHLGPS